VAAVAFKETMTKRFAILIVTAVSAAVLASSALAKATVLLPGGTYLNQAASTGLSCLTGSGGAAGTTTFIVTVQSNQGGQGATFKVDYTFDPDDPALESFSGSQTVHASAPSGTGVAQSVPVSIPVSSDSGLVAQVANTTVISIGSDGTLYYDALNLNAWSCDSATAQGGGGSGGSGSSTGNCAAAYPLMVKLGLEVYTSGARGELLKKIVESGVQCLKGKPKDAAKKMDEFVKELSKQAKYLTPTQVAQWTDEANAIKATLLG
jgi:hypothetical protein